MRVASSPAPVAGSPVSPEPRPRPNPALPRRPARGSSPLPSPTRGAEPCSTIPTSCTSWSPIVTARPVRWPPRDEGAASTVRCSGLAGVTAGEPHPSRSLTGANDTIGAPPGSPGTGAPSASPALRCAGCRLASAPSATWPSSWCAPRRPPPSPGPDGWAGATRTAPTVLPSRPCAPSSPRCRWTASSSSARARRTRRRCCSTARRSGTARARCATWPSTRSTAPRSRRSAAATRSSVIAVSERGTMFNPGPCVYMEKIAVGPDAVGLDRHHRVADPEPALGGQGQGRERPRPHGRHPRP